MSGGVQALMYAPGYGIRDLSFEDPAAGGVNHLALSSQPKGSLTGLKAERFMGCLVRLRLKVPCMHLL